jgi:hypothetical protein
MVFVVFWSFWPATTPTTAESMNYSVLVTGGVLLFSMFYYVVWARKSYKGPLVEVGVGEERGYGGESRGEDFASGSAI